MLEWESEFNHYWHVSGMELDEQIPLQLQKAQANNAVELGPAHARHLFRTTAGPTQDWSLRTQTMDAPSPRDDITLRPPHFQMNQPAWRPFEPWPMP